MLKHEPAWFKSAVLYQIYPRSFHDSNGDGVGDLAGITQKLDYLASQHDSLGVNAIWLSPFYPSPMADFGYDVTDYCDVDPVFGTLHDFKKLLHEAHKRGIKVVIDFIPNHTSDKHPWFKESRASKDNPKRDWYVWKDAKPDGSPPNNWPAYFGGSAWEHDLATGQYYLHSFLPQQPDLNWENPEVRKAMKEVIKFWLDLGVDGLRVDAVYYLSKDPQYRDNPPDLRTPDPNDFKWRYNRDGPRLYAHLREIASVLKGYKNRFMVTEAYPEKWHNVVSYIRFYRDVAPSVSAPFNFEGIEMNWDAKSFRSFITRFQLKLHRNYVPVYTLGNHDKARLATRIGPAASRTAAMMLMTLPGMPILYYGDELGMTNGLIKPSEVRDPFEIRVPGRGNGRDPERTPMQWNNGENAGFSTHQPWLPIPESYRHVNVAGESDEPYSMLNLYKQLISMRNGLGVLKYGSYNTVILDDNVLGYQRKLDGDVATIVLNFSDKMVHIKSKHLNGKVMLSTYGDIEVNTPVSGRYTLRPNEGFILHNVPAKIKTYAKPKPKPKNKRKKSNA